MGHKGGRARGSRLPPGQTRLSFGDSDAGVLATVGEPALGPEIGGGGRLTALIVPPVAVALPVRVAKLVGVPEAEGGVAVAGQAEDVAGAIADGVALGDRADVGRPAPLEG